MQHKHTETEVEKRHEQINNAADYLYGTSVFSIGKSRKAMSVINRLRLPPLPLLADNKKERQEYENANNRSIFNRISKFLDKCWDNLFDVLDEHNKAPFTPIPLYTIEVTNETLPEETMPV